MDCLPLPLAMQAGSSTSNFGFAPLLDVSRSVLRSAYRVCLDSAVWGHGAAGIELDGLDELRTIDRGCGSDVKGVKFPIAWEPQLLVQNLI